jgi:hypothetical protein
VWISRARRTLDVNVAFVLAQPPRWEVDGIYPPDGVRITASERRRAINRARLHLLAELRRADGERAP